MKNSFLFLTLFALLTSVASAQMKCAPGKCGGSMSSAEKPSVKLLYKGNISYKAIDIKAGMYSCAQCKMDVKALDYATQAVKKNGDTYFFDDIGCMILWLKEHQTDIVKLYVKTVDTHKWLEAAKANYSRIAPSPMGYGFAAVESTKEGLVSYEKMQDLILKGQTLRNPEVKKKLLP